MSLLADLLSSILERRPGRFRRGQRDGRSIGALADALLTEQGEVTGMTLAAEILDRYAEMNEAEKRLFFDIMARRMDVDAARVREALAAYEAAPGRDSYEAFSSAAEPRRQELIRRLNQVPGGTARLVAMRADLLRFVPDAADYAALDVDFRHLFSSWFNRGFLVLRPVNWKSPAHVLEKIIAYEAVHAISDWDDLRRRVEPGDRRCFAFFHPAMPDEPLIFVEVALTQGIPNSIQALLSEDRDLLHAEDADTAVFYSISNCQAGLAGISFGNSLIKQVVADLSAELPGLRTFVTLSPIPGLVRWLEATGTREEADDPARLRVLAAHYLLEAKMPDGSPRDPVARFHLGNGATIHAVHAGADTSEKGRGQSAGAMVNYLYDLPKISQNHERFAKAQAIAASSEVQALSAAAASVNA